MCPRRKNSFPGLEMLHDGPVMECSGLVMELDGLGTLHDGRGKLRDGLEMECSGPEKLFSRAETFYLERGNALFPARKQRGEAG